MPVKGPHKRRFIPILKKIIFNADDFGLTRGINQGIIRAFTEGVVRSASLMPVGMAYDDAVRLAKENPGLDIGIHLCLVEEKPLLTNKEIPSLVVKDGYFSRYELWFILNYYLGRINLKEIERELEAQVQRVKESGIRATHIDSHDYIHMLPSILKIVMRLARKYSIPFIRYPYERPVIFTARPPRYMLSFILNMLCVVSNKIIREAGLFRTNYFYGVLSSGHLSESCLTKILRTVDKGMTEITCHPGIYDEEAKRYDYWKYEWEGELRALTSPNIKKIIKDLNIQLVNFREIL